MKIKMASVDIGPLEKAYVNDVLASGWLSRRTYIPRFEQEIARLHGQKYGMMCNSGTDALRIGLAALKEVYGWRDGSEVLVPAVTFAATVNVVLQTFLTPVFVDVDRTTYNMNMAEVAKRIGLATVAVIPVHLFGLSADIGVLMPIARKYNLRVLEDSCETMFVYKPEGDMTVFSTYTAHLIQTGVGGVLTTNDKHLDKLARSYMNHGRSENGLNYEYERVGYSSRVTELEAALGCAQLERHDWLISRRQYIAEELWNRLPQDKLQLPVVDKPCAWMFFPVVLREGDRDAFRDYLLDGCGIETREMMPLINQGPYKKFVKPGQFPVAEGLNKNGVLLPCHPGLTDEDIEHIVSSVKGFFDDPAHSISKLDAHAPTAHS